MLIAPVGLPKHAIHQVLARHKPKNTLSTLIQSPALWWTELLHSERHFKLFCCLRLSVCPKMISPRSLAGTNHKNTGCASIQSSAAWWKELLHNETYFHIILLSVPVRLPKNDIHQMPGRYKQEKYPMYFNITPRRMVDRTASQ